MGVVSFTKSVSNKRYTNTNISMVSFIIFLLFCSFKAVVGKKTVIQISVQFCFRKVEAVFYGWQYSFPCIRSASKIDLNQHFMANCVRLSSIFEVGPF